MNFKVLFRMISHYRACHQMRQKAFWNLRIVIFVVLRLVLKKSFLPMPMCEKSIFLLTLLKEKIIGYHPLVQETTHAFHTDFTIYYYKKNTDRIESSLSLTISSQRVLF